MFGTYAYSFTGDHYRGDFATREEAVREGIEAARRSAEGPMSIYVGRRVGGDPKSSGHARAILTNIVARAREEFGDAASDYLSRLSKEQVQNLDQSLQESIAAWLERYNLMPTFFRIDAVGEYPVPASTQTNTIGDGREVQEIGSSDYGG